MCIRDRSFSGSGDYFLNSLYGYQLEPWVAAYGVENILLVATNDLILDRLSVIKKITEFLGEPTWVLSENAIVSNSAGGPKLDHRSLVGRVVTSRIYRDAIRTYTPEILKKQLRQRVMKEQSQNIIGIPPSLKVTLTRAFREDYDQLILQFGEQCIPDYWD